MTRTILRRRIDCDGAFNLRDLGGYRGSDGRTVRWRTLFRADGLHRIPSVGRRAIEELRWRTVIDLRTITEVDGGRFAGDGIDVVHLPVLRDPWDAAALAADDDDPVEILSASYLDMTEQGAAAIATAFELLAVRTRLPAVFHCSAGKDRTGVLAALVLAALGVDDDQIAVDYHLSAAAMDRLVDWVMTNGPEVAEHVTRPPAAFLACPPAAVRSFLQRLREQHGSVEFYLADIGVERATVEFLRDTLLEY